MKRSEINRIETGARKAGAKTGNCSCGSGKRNRRREEEIVVLKTR